MTDRNSSTSALNYCYNNEHEPRRNITQQNPTTVSIRISQGNETAPWATDIITTNGTLCRKHTIQYDTIEQFNVTRKLSIQVNLAHVGRN